MPQHSPTFLAGLLDTITRLAIRRSIGVLSVAIALAVLSIVLTVLLLDFRTSRLDLLNPESDYNKLWLDYIREFGASDDVLVVVEGDSRDQVTPVLDEVASTLAREDRHFRSVLHQVDLSKIRSKGLHYLPPNELSAIEQFVVETEPIVAGQWSQLTVGNTAAAMAYRLAMASRDPTGRALERVEAELDHWSGSLQQALAAEPGYRTAWPQVVEPTLPGGIFENEYFLMADGCMGVVLLQIVENTEGSSFARGTKAIESLRRHVENISSRYPRVRIGLTGLPVMENDEMRSSQSAMIEASLLSLFGVAILFVAGFGGIRHPMLTVAVLLLAMAWSFGYITLAVGHLNILSVSFAVILIGLGIDFGIHYVARYLQHRAASEPCDEALTRTAVGVGPGILTGAVTTAIAFFAAGLTEFTGIAELGIVAGGGILLCCAGALTVLPALIHLTDARRQGPERMEGASGPGLARWRGSPAFAGDSRVCDRGSEIEDIPRPLDIYGWLSPLFRRPAWLLCVSIGLTALAATGMSRLWYDHNLLNLQPEDLDSIRLEHRLIEESDQSVWFALSLAKSREELLARKGQFEECESVDRVEEIASLIPGDEQVKRPMIERIRSRLTDLPVRAPQIPIERPEALDGPLAQLQTTLTSGLRGEQVASRIQWIRAALRQMPESECYRRLSQYQRQMADDLLEGLHSLRDVSNPEPPEFSDLPESLVARFLGSGGRHLMRVYSRANIWDMDAMEQFVADVRSVDEHATGNPLQTYEASRQMKRSYEQAALFSLLAILVVLYFDFRSLRYTLLAVVPVGVGMLLLFGVLGWLGEPLNPANMIVLPLILGIGVDDGVHVIHDYLRRKGPYRMSPSTASAVLITSLTTMVGFGSLMIASHRGLQSLGRVLTIGVTCCLFTALILLPAALAWSSRDAEADEGDSVEMDEREPGGEYEEASGGEGTSVKPARRAA